MMNLGATRCAGGLALAMAASVAFATPLRAQEQPINVALVTPIQIFPAEQAIKGFRWNIIYGRNSAMTGLDLGIANHVEGPMRGVQWGVVNLTQSLSGWQAGAVNYSVGDALGLQWGWFNWSGMNRGLQLGLVNYTERANGVQVGLINIIKQGGQFPVMIIVNWGFN